ncbi:MAG: sigma factor, partial [Bryobacteraceae bacterium]
MDFNRLVKEHQAMVYSVAWHFLRDRPLAEEVAQDVFLSLHRNLATIE